MKYFMLLFFVSSLSVFADSDKPLSITVPFRDNSIKIDRETGKILNLTYKTIKEIEESEILGKIIDLYYPTELINCYIFVFKNENVIYQIAANHEDRNHQRKLKDLDLTQFYAIGYYGIMYPDKERTRMFRVTRYGTPFDFLNEIDPEKYVSIADIEKMLGISFEIGGRGGFIQPFSTYICRLDNGILAVLASPSNDKNKSYFMGSWSFTPKKETQR
jgi:hypothetical protein